MSILAQKIKPLILYLFLPLILLLVFWQTFLLPSLSSSSKPPAFVSPLSQPNPTPVVSFPQTIRIEKLNVSTQIESVSLAPDGRMAVPSNTKNVAWYSLGPKPGQTGNAVIDGHYDDPEGASVFYDLRLLSPGDIVTVDSDSGPRYTFSVIKSEVFLDASFPIDQVFGPSTDKNLNLITCAGNYNPKTKNYDKRLVVFTRLLSAE